MKKAIIICGSIVAISGIIMGLAVTTLVAAAVMLSGSYGERIEIKNGELYYTKNVEKADAEKLAAFLEKQYGELENQKTFQVDRDGEDVIVRMCAQSSTWESDKMDFSFYALEVLLQSQVFENENVIFQVCNERLEPMKSFDKFPAGDQKDKQ